MPDLSQDQVEKRATIQKSATIWGGVAGVVAGLLALWILGGQGGAVRYGGAVVIALAVGFLVFKASFKSGAISAQCEKCAATFSRSRTDHVETLASSTDKEERKEQPDKSTKVTTWTEDSFDVVDSYTCAKCADVTTNTYKTTRRRDEKSDIEPYKAPKTAEQPKKGGNQSQKAAPAAKQDRKGASTKPGGSGSRKG